PAVVPLLGFAMGAAVVHPLAPGTGGLLTQADGLCAAYLADCAKLFGTLPFAQIRSGWAAAALALGAAGGSFYAWRDGRSEVRVPPLGHPQAEGGEGGAPAPWPDRPGCNRASLRAGGRRKRCCGLVQRARPVCQRAQARGRRERRGVEG